MQREADFRPFCRALQNKILLPVYPKPLGVSKPFVVYGRNDKDVFGHQDKIGLFPKCVQHGDEQVAFVVAVSEVVLYGLLRGVGSEAVDPVGDAGDIVQYALYFTEFTPAVFGQFLRLVCYLPGGAYFVCIDAVVGADLCFVRYLQGFCRDIDKRDEKNSDDEQREVF